jgi:hypothetical protein
MIEQPSLTPPASTGGQSHHSRLKPLLRAALAVADRLPLPWGLPGRYAILSLLSLILLAVVIPASARAAETRLTQEAPTYVEDEVFSIMLKGEGTARISVQAYEADAVFGGEERRWSAAHDALPAYLTPVSNLYSARVRDGSASVIFQTDSFSTDLLDVYVWQADTREWRHWPSVWEPETGEIRAVVPNAPAALFEVNGTAPLLGTTLGVDHSFDAANAGLLTMLLLEGAEGQADGSLNIDPLAEPPDIPDTTALLPEAHIPDVVSLNATLLNRSATRKHIESLLDLADQYDGVVLDYGRLESDQGEAFQTLIEALAPEMREQEALLAVRVPTPAELDGGWETYGYDWAALGEQVDLIIAAPPGSPAEHRAGGQTDRFLRWATGQVSRTQLVIATSTLSLDEWGSQLNPLSYDYALAPLGSVRLNREGIAPSVSPAADEELTFELVGEAVDFQHDEATNAYHYDYYTGDGIHRVWITTGAALHTRLSWLSTYRTGGLLVEDYFSEDASPDIYLAVQSFHAQQPSTLDPLFRLRWRVQDASGAVLTDSTTDLGTPLAWTASEEGEYIVHAALVGETVSELGAAAVIIGGQDVGVAPGSEGVVAGAPDLGAGPTPLAVIPEGMPPPVVPPRVFGGFELGGQVNHVMNDPERMRDTGMTWVKFQLAWYEGLDPSIAWELVEQGREHNFKVLLSIPGRDHYPASINIPEYLDFLRGVAYYGPDAIEVWNEANIDYEWPRGQIDGVRYTREMLAPAYNAIKEVNPNIMVISGALAPTGAFFGEGGCSLQGYGCDDWLYLQQMAENGAANYMDCVGAHYNSGATAPSATTGHPADPGYQHYSWYFGGMVSLYGGTFGRPVCFTELGYLSGEGYGAVPGRFGWAANTTVAQQALWLAEAAQMSMQSGNVRLMIVWNFDFSYWGDDPMAGYAIVRPGGGCPACDALGLVMP